MKELEGKIIQRFNENNKLIGTIEAKEMELEAGLFGWVLANIYVDPKYRNKGIGESLLNSMLEKLADKKEIVAHCNEMSKPMLLKAGFIDKVENIMVLRK